MSHVYVCVPVLRLFRIREKNIIYVYDHDVYKLTNVVLYEHKISSFIYYFTTDTQPLCYHDNNNNIIRNTCLCCEYNYILLFLTIVFIKR